MTRRGSTRKSNVAHPKAEREVTAGAWINMDSHFPGMMGREKEMSTAITWKANEGWVPALLASVRGHWTSQRRRRGWANTVDCIVSEELCLLQWMGRRSLCGHCCTPPQTRTGLPIGCVGSSEFPRKPALLIPRERIKTKGTSEWIQGVSTDFLKNGL